MAYILFQCSSCLNNIAVDDDYVGQVIECPGCKQKLLAPATKCKFQCKHCQTVLLAPAGMAGSVRYCPECDTKFVVPPPSNEKPKFHLKTKPSASCPSAKSEGSAHTGKQTTCPKCNSVITFSQAQVDQSMRSYTPYSCPKCGEEVVLSGSPPPRLCPYCRGIICSDAIVCVNCGTNLKTGQRMGTTQSSSNGLSVGAIMGICGLILVAVFVLMSGIGSCNREMPEGADSKQSSSALSGIFGSSKEDDELYEYTKVRAENAKTIKEKTELLSAYVQKYPKGRHVGEIRALLELAKEDLVKWNAQMKVGTIIANCYITLGSGQTIPVQGWLQLIKPDVESLDALIHNISNDGELNQLWANFKSPLYSREDSTYRYDNLYWSRVGKLIAEQLKGTLIARGDIEQGQLAFPDLPPGRYLLYGIGRGGQNVVMYFEDINVEGGKTTVAKRSLGAVYDGDFILDSWLPF